MNVRYRVELTAEERADLNKMLGAGKHAARKLKRAQILLAADAGASDEEIARTIGVGGSTIYRTKRRFMAVSLEAALSEEPRPGAERKLTGNEQALLIATACAKPPAGRSRWTLELLADEMVKLTEHESLSRETVRRRLAENDLKPWRKNMWCIPKVDAEYVARMEDVLDLYNEEPDPKRPVVCFDESPTQLIGEVREPIPAKPGQLERFDCEYRRNGTANLFVFLDAHRPWRRVKVTDRRTAQDFAGLRSVHARAGRCPLSPGPADPCGDGQPFDPFPRRPLRSLPGSRSAPRVAPARVPLHPQARELAEYGRDRDRCVARPVPRPPHWRARAPRLRDCRLGAATQRARRSRPMDVHHRTRPHQARSRLPGSGQRVIIPVQRY